MNKIEKLLTELCPDGIDFKEIGAVVKILRGKRLTKNQLSDDEKYPVYQGGLEPLGYYGQNNRIANTVMVINVGASAGTVRYSSVDFWSSDGCFCIGHSDLLISRYMYYALLCHENILRSKVRFAGIPTLDASAVEHIKIPIPPLAIQQEIVKILDNFTELKAELEAELEARKKQYEYYRNQLLTFDRQTDRQTDRVRWVSLGEIIILEYGKPLKENERDGGCYPVLGSNGRVGSHSSYLIKGPCIIMGRKGSAGAVVWEENNCYPIDTTFFVKQLEDNIVLKYLFYILQIINFGTDKQDGGVPGLNRNNVYKIKIPVPPLAEQERIVTALDKFDALVNDISVGLPAELSARRKQYEYYRDQLLTFKPLEMQNAN